MKTIISNQRLFSGLKGIMYINPQHYTWHILSAMTIIATIIINNTLLVSYLLKNKKEPQQIGIWWRGEGDGTGSSKGQEI